MLPIGEITMNTLCCAVSVHSSSRDEAERTQASLLGSAAGKRSVSTSVVVRIVMVLAFDALTLVVGRASRP